MAATSDRSKLLVTGAGGMVGRNLLDHPRSADWEILAPGSRELDLRDKNAVFAYLDEFRPAAVIHAAGVVGGIQANIAEPVRFLAANTEIGLNVVTGCIAAKVPTLINLASSCMYPRALGSGLSEDKILSGPLEPTNEGYALAKILTMRACEFAMREDATLNYKTLIPCNLYGRWDKFDPRHSHLIPAIIYKVHQAKLTGASEIEIWGDGTARREFMYAGDLADAIFRALSNPSILPDALNIGLGHDHSINDYYAIVADIIGWEGQFRHDLGRPVGMKQKLLDVTRQSEWGWTPQTGLEDGIRATYDFYLKDQTR